MYAGLGIEQQWLSAAAAGSARFLRRFTPSPSTASPSYALWTRKVGRAAAVVNRLGFTNPSKSGSCNDGGRSVLDRGEIWNQRELHGRCRHGRFCAEECAPRAVHGGLLRSLSSLSRAPTVTTTPAAAALTGGELFMCNSSNEPYFDVHFVCSSLIPNSCRASFHRVYFTLLQNDYMGPSVGLIDVIS